MNDIPDVIILRYAKQISVEKQIHLVPSTLAFFVFLVHLFEKEAEWSAERGLHFVKYSIREFANLAQMSHIFEALKILDECDLITREKEGKAYITYMDLSVFEKLEERS